MSVKFQTRRPSSPPEGMVIKTRQLSDDSQLQYVQIDIGTGTSSSPIVSGNGFPVDVQTRVSASIASGSIIVSSGSAVITSGSLIVTNNVSASMGRIMGDDSASHYFHFDAEGLRTCAQPYLQAMAEGDIAGHVPFSKFGRVTGVNTGIVDVISWGAAAYTFPATAGMNMRLVSTSTSDAAGEAGARSVTIQYLNETNTSASEIIALNGTTPVFTSSSKIRRINKSFVQTAGSIGAAAGTINIYHDTTASPTYSTIDTGLTQSRQMVYTVPAGKTLYIVQVHYSSGIGGTSTKLEFCTFTNRATVDPITGAVSTIFYPYNEVGVMNNGFELNLESPTKIPATADLKISVQGDSAQGAVCTAAIRGWLE